MTYNSTMKTAAVIAVIAYRIILWAVRILWFCFKAVVNIILWLLRALFWTMLFLTRIIL